MDNRGAWVLKGAFRVNRVCVLTGVEHAETFWGRWTFGKTALKRGLFGCVKRAVKQPEKWLENHEKIFNKVFNTKKLSLPQ